jgi:hypothetical protein
MKLRTSPAVVALALLAFPLVALAAPSDATGAISQYSYVIASTDTGGGGAIITHFNEIDTWTGSLVGMSASHGTCKTSSNRTSCTIDGSFNGSLNGVSGTASFSESVDVDPATGAYSGRIHFDGSSGGLATAHGHGSVQGSRTTGTYQISIGL